MKLRHSATSPFVRKIVVALHELGMNDQVERIPSNVLKREVREGLPNPLGKVPCLETDDGMTLYDSPVIVEYLDSLKGGGRLIPPSGRARWDALRRQALGDGILDNTVLSFIETLRKPERQSAGWIAHNRSGSERAIKALESEADQLGGAADVGKITIAIAIDFFDMHFPDAGWRASCPKLAAWFEEFKQRPSMRASVLVDPRKTT
jgi:glutathione S-transferase